MSNFSTSSLPLLTIYSAWPTAERNATAILSPSLDKQSLQRVGYVAQRDFQQYWCLLLYICISCQIISIFWRYWWKAPSNIPIVAYPTPFGRWLTAWRLMIDAEAIVLEAYDKYHGKPFAIPTTERWIVFVSEREAVKRLHKESELVLSTEQALHELAFTDKILAIHQQPPEHKGPKSEQHRVVIGILKNKLRSKIPDMSKGLQQRVRDAIALEVPHLHDKERLHHNEWQKVRLMPALLRIFTRVNLLAFFGEEGVNNPAIYYYTVSFFWSCASGFFVFNIVPMWLVPIVGPMAMILGVARGKVFSFLLQMASRYHQDKGSEHKTMNGNVIQWTTEMAHIKDPVTVAKTILGLIFASAFQIPMITQSCIHRLCKYTECHEKLLDEAEEYRDMEFSSRNQEMPYFDSLLRETARLCPGPIVTSPRTVMKAYTSIEDGYHVPTGNWIAVPQLAVMQDDKIWPRAKSFEPFRFVNEENLTSETRFTHPGYEFPFWGSTQNACPSRFYVSVIMKMVLAHLLREYEIELENPKMSSYIPFGVVRVPNPFLILRVRRREAINAIDGVTIPGN